MCLKAFWPSMDTSEAFAHIYSQNSGVSSALIRLFIMYMTRTCGYMMLCLCCGSLQAMSREVPGRKHWQRYPLSSECGSVVLQSLYTCQGMSGHTAKWPYMGILPEQEVGVIGWLSAVVSAYVIDQRGGEAVCSAPMCLSELNLKYCGSFLDILKVYCH